jgi:hypothetical protein
MFIFVQQLIAANKKTKATTLDLGNCGRFGGFSGKC